MDESKFRVFRGEDGKWNAEVYHRGQFRRPKRDAEGNIKRDAKGNPEWGPREDAVPGRDDLRPAVMGGYATREEATAAGEAYLGLRDCANCGAPAGVGCRDRGAGPASNARAPKKRTKAKAKKPAAEKPPDE